MRTLAFATLLLLAAAAAGQDQPAPLPPKEPQIQVTYLNVCTPEPDETKELTGALAKVPLVPPFSSDFEVARGRSTVTGGEIAARLTGGNVPPSTWVRMRREFASGFFANVQYTMTRDENGLFEVLVFRVRDPKELMQVTLTDSANGANPTAMLATDTPPSRIRLERFAKTSVGLSRCPAADQKQYEPLFRSAARIMATYRDLLGVRKTVPAEFSRLGPAAPPKGKGAASKPLAATPQKP